MIGLLDLRDFGVVADQVPEFAPERLADPAHATDGLHQRLLHVVLIGESNALPDAGLQDLAEADRL